MSNITSFMLGKWDTGKPMPEGRCSFGCIALGDNIYCLGGYKPSGSGFTTEVWIYNTIANQWYAGKNMPFVGQPICTAYQDKIYCFYSQSSKSHLYAYDTLDDSWSLVSTSSSMTVPSTGISTTVLTVSGGIHIHTLYSSSIYSLQYDIVSDTWTRSSLNVPKWSNPNLVISNGYRYYMGGTDLDTILRYNLETNKGEQIGRLTFGRVDFGCASLGDDVYCIGGVSSSSKSLRCLEIYNTVAGKWIESFHIPTPRHNFGCVGVNGSIYCIGGARDDLSAYQGILDSVEIFTPGEIISVAETTTITHKYQKSDGSSIRQNSAFKIEVGSAYTAYALNIKGYHCIGYKLDDGEMQNGTSVTIADVQEERIITFVYESGDPPEEDRVIITAKYQTQDGANILPETAEFAQKGTTYDMTAPMIEDYIYIGYRLDGGTLLEGQQPEIINVQQDQTIILVYREGPDPGTDPGPGTNPGGGNGCCCAPMLKMEFPVCSCNDQLFRNIADAINNTPKKDCTCK